MSRTLATFLALAALSTPRTAAPQVRSVQGPAGSAAAAAHCAAGLDDQAGGACIEASREPELGRLYPISDRLFVEPIFGRVGIHTTVPTAPLTVAGAFHLDGDLALLDRTQSILFSNADGPGEQAPMVRLFSETNPEAERLVFSESTSFDEVGLRYRTIGLDHDFVFQYADDAPVLAVDLDGRRIGVGTDDPLTDIHVRDTGDAELWLEADTDNALEIDHPALRMTQDGGFVESRVGIGLGTSTNHLMVQNLYEFADTHFLVVDTGGAGARRFEFHNTDVVGNSTDVEARIDQNGNLEIDGSVFSPAADLAEFYPVSGTVEPGEVVAFTGEGLTLGRALAGDGRRLAGVVSSRPAFVMGLSYTVDDEQGRFPAAASDAERFEGTGEHAVDRAVRHEIQANGRAPLALAGRVPCKVNTENGPIRPGDLLTVSSLLPGHAARSIGSGPIVGTALQPLTAGEGSILVFVNVGWFGRDASHALSQRLAELERIVADLARR